MATCLFVDEICTYQAQFVVSHPEAPPCWPMAPSAVHLSTEWATGAVLRLRADGVVRSRTLVRPGPQVFVGVVAAGSSVQGAPFPGGDGFGAAFEASYERGGATYSAASYDLGQTWTEDIMSVTGTLPARATEQNTGIRYLATWAASVWTLWRRYPGESAWADVSTIASDGVAAQAGLTCDVVSDGALIFHYDDGTEVKERYSRDHGVTWTNT